MRESGDAGMTIKKSWQINYHLIAVRAPLPQTCIPCTSAVLTNHPISQTRTKPL
jgi:hypothetical protein